MSTASNVKDTSRRHFLKATLTTAGAAALPWQVSAAQAPAARYRRYNVMSPKGQIALASYARGVKAMLALPAKDPHNWFRNAFTHLMDCPHGNWWFYVWHRGYVGYFEQTIRELSGDKDFAMPYWDWSTTPRIPDGMFNGPLTPTAADFAPYTKDIDTFTNFIQPELKKFWSALTPAQTAQLNARGYTSFDKMWNDVSGFVPATPTKPAHIDPTNEAFAQTQIARYLTPQNPNLSEQVTFNCSPLVVYAGLLPVSFYDPVRLISFNSSKSPSHNTPPPNRTVFATLEAFPHNSTHNYIGGVGPIPNGPWGNMTNNLSPVDPIFFLHHANMDRLWDVWTRKQQAWGFATLPDKTADPGYYSEPFLFYTNAAGEPVGPASAGQYTSMSRWDYDYEAGTGEDIVRLGKPLLTASHAAAPAVGVLKAHAATVTLGAGLVKAHLAADRPASLIALVTIPRPGSSSAGRNFDVLVGAPDNVTQVNPDSPFYAGTIAFFGGMFGMAGMGDDATFLVPLPKHPEAFKGLGATNAVSLNIRVVPSRTGGASVLKAATVRTI